MGTDYFNVAGVFPVYVELLTYQISMVCAGNCPRWRYLLTCYIMTSSVISFAYFTHQGVKRGKTLILVALQIFREPSKSFCFLLANQATTHAATKIAESFSSVCCHTRSSHFEKRRAKQKATCQVSLMGNYCYHVILLVLVYHRIRSEK